MDESKLTTIKIDPANTINEKPIYVSELIDTFFMVPLQTDSVCFVNSISKLLIDSDTIFILNKEFREILIFTLAGKYTGKISNIGTRPGEYIKTTDITLDYNQKELVVFDDVSSKHIFYSYSGRFIREVPVFRYTSQFAYLGNNQFIRINDFQAPDRNNRFVCFITNERDSVITKAFPYEKKMLGTLCSKKVLSQTGKRVFYSPLFDNKIYEVKDQGFIPMYKIDFGVYNMGSDPDSLKSPDRLPAEKVIYFENWCENESTASFHYFFINKTGLLGFYPVLYDKGTKKIVYPLSKFFIDIPFLGWGSLTLMSYNNYFVSNKRAKDIIADIQSINSGALPTGIPDKQWQINLKKYSHQVNTLNKLTQTDNMVLFFYKFKRL